MQLKNKDRCSVYVTVNVSTGYNLMFHIAPLASYIILFFWHICYNKYVVTCPSPCPVRVMLSCNSVARASYVQVALVLYNATI